MILTRKIFLEKQGKKVPCAKSFENARLRKTARRSFPARRQNYEPNLIFNTLFYGLAAYRLRQLSHKLNDFYPLVFSHSRIAKLLDFLVKLP